MIPQLTILIGTAWFFAVLAWDVNADFKKWRKAISVRHRSEWRKRVLLVLPSIALITMAHPAQSGFCWASFWVLVDTASMLGFGWWLLFDGWYNTRRRNYLIKTGAAPMYYNPFTFFYTGSFNEEGHSDSWLDKMQFLLGNTLSKIIKVTGVSVSLTVYILSFIKFNHQ